MSTKLIMMIISQYIHIPNCYIPKTNTVFYVNYISVKLGRGWGVEKGSTVDAWTTGFELWLEITMYGIKRPGVWVLILSKLFQLPALGRVIYQFFCFRGRDSKTQIFLLEEGMCSALNPRIVQGSTIKWERVVLRKMGNFDFEHPNKNTL